MERFRLEILRRSRTAIACSRSPASSQCGHVIELPLFSPVSQAFDLMIFRIRKVETVDGRVFIVTLNVLLCSHTLYPLSPRPCISSRRWSLMIGRILSSQTKGFKDWNDFEQAIEFCLISSSVVHLYILNSWRRT